MPATNSKQAQPSPDVVDYMLKRHRNNIAVRKSREKSRQKQKETQDKVKALKEENEGLELRVKILTKELTLLKSLFLEHAAGSGDLKPTIASLEQAISKTSLEQAISEGDESDTTMKMEFFESDSVVPVNEAAVRKDHKYTSLQ